MYNVILSRGKEKLYIQGQKYAGKINWFRLSYNRPFGAAKDESLWKFPEGSKTVMSTASSFTVRVKAEHFDNYVMDKVLKEGWEEQEFKTPTIKQSYKGGYSLSHLGYHNPENILPYPKEAYSEVHNYSHVKVEYTDIDLSIVDQEEYLYSLLYGVKNEDPI